jgi:hypothetical protein
VLLKIGDNQKILKIGITSKHCSTLVESVLRSLMKNERVQMNVYRVLLLILLYTSKKRVVVMPVEMLVAKICTISTSYFTVRLMNALDVLNEVVECV